MQKFPAPKTSIWSAKKFWSSSSWSRWWLPVRRRKNLSPPATLTPGNPRREPPSKLRHLAETKFHRQQTTRKWSRLWIEKFFISHTQSLGLLSFGNVLEWIFSKYLRVVIGLFNLMFLEVLHTLASLII